MLLITSIQRILNSYFKQQNTTPKVSSNYIDRALTSINMSNHNKMLDHLLTEMLKDAN